jgi:uncharacterized membrane protein
VITDPRAEASMRWQDSIPGLATAFLWALSPVFTVEGLEELDSPLLGVSIGVVLSVLAYALVLAATPGERRSARDLPREGVALKLVSGMLVALAIWGRWEALDLADVGVVLALNLLAVPTVLLLAPVIAGRHAERVDARIWLGAGLVVTGSLLLIAVD